MERFFREIILPCLPPSLCPPMVSATQSFKYVGMEITWVGKGVEEYGHLKGDPDNVLVRVDPRYFRPTEVELLLVSIVPVKASHVLSHKP